MKNNKNNLPSYPVIGGTNNAAAKALINEYELSCWKLVEYIKVTASLPTQGIMATDMAIAEAIGGRRHRSSTRMIMVKLAAQGLVTEESHTARGFSYKLTGAGHKAYGKIQKIEAEWAKKHPANRYAPVPARVTLKMKVVALLGRIGVLEAENASLARENESLKNTIKLLTSVGVSPKKP